MQEVKSTFASALQRMQDYPEFFFTATSAVFFKWLQRVDPLSFEEVRRRVKEDRLEICGGWFLEPDCNLPSGEAFARQALYAQRYFKQQFGKICTIGSNVDSFGHSPTLPMLLRQSGMTHYVFMRPRTREPLFRWQSPDGSTVCALSLPAEYTCWFHEPTVKNINQTLERTTSYREMVCCYGVGNHGGGPTIENIESIRSLRSSFPETTLNFSTFAQFFQTVEASALPAKSGAFEKVNPGCYSIDSAFKKEHRLAQRRLLQADALMTMACLNTGRWQQETQEMQKLWEQVLFNQFHDTLGGTAIQTARDEGLRQLSAASAGAHTLQMLAMQDIVNSTDTRGEGWPLWLFNPNASDFEGVAEVEAEWFCQAPLRLLDAAGQELAYQRIHTDTKVRHTTLGGRRRFLFQAKVPAYGWAIYRMCKQAPTVSCDDARTGAVQVGVRTMENSRLRVAFDAQGMLCAVEEKATGYNALRGSCEYQVWLDQRDAWGGLQGRSYEDTGKRFALVALEKVEEGSLRQTMRATYCYGASRIRQHFHLYEGEQGLVVETELWWHEPWHMLKLQFPTRCNQVRTQIAYGELCRTIEDGEDYYMHGWADIYQPEQGGLCIANDAKYAFSCIDGNFGLTVLRSAIYAQGNSPSWQNGQESYSYTDLGEQRFVMVLRPHRHALPAQALVQAADRACGAYAYLCDSSHDGAQQPEGIAAKLRSDNAAVSIVLCKKAEDDAGVIIRLLNLTAETQTTCLRAGDWQQQVTLPAYRLYTLHLDLQRGVAKEVNLLEWEDNDA